MKAIRNHKYFVLDVVNMVLGGILILLGIYAFVDITMHQQLLPFILLIGGIINIGNSCRQEANPKALTPFYIIMGYLCIVMACIIWMGFGGLT